MWWCWTGSTPGPGPSPPGDACDERIARAAHADRAKGPDTGAPSRTPSVAADVISSSRSLPARVRWRVSLRQHCPHRRSHAPSRAPGSGVAHTREPPETDRQTRGSEPAREWRPASTPSRTRPVSPTVADGSTTSRAAPSTGVPSVGRTRCAGGYPHSSSSTAVPWRHRDRRRRKRPRHGGAGRQCALPGRQARLRRRGPQLQRGLCCGGRRPPRLHVRPHRKHRRHVRVRIPRRPLGQPWPERADRPELAFLVRGDAGHWDSRISADIQALLGSLLTSMGTAAAIIAIIV